MGIDRMKKWNWKHAGHPGEAAFPVGPKGEEYVLEGVAAEQVGVEGRKRRESH